MKPVITMIHTVFPIIAPLKKIFETSLKPGSFQLYNMVDDSIVPRILAAGSITPDITGTVFDHVASAARFGSDVIMVTCSSISETVDLIQPLVKIPVIKIDDAMTDEAVKTAKTLGVVATITTALQPTMNQLKLKAKQNQQNINLVPCLCWEAYEDLMRNGNPAQHDRIVLHAIENILGEVDAIVLSQASLDRLVPLLAQKTDKPVFSSPVSGVGRVIAKLASKFRVEVNE